MVQVRVRDDERAYFVLAFFQVSCIGNYIVHARRRFVGKMHAGVNYDNVVADFYYGHIFSDFFHSAQGNNANYSFFRQGDFADI